MHPMRTSAPTTPRDRPALRALKELRARRAAEAASAVTPAAPEDSEEKHKNIEREGLKSLKSPFELALLEIDDPEVAWRLVALRQLIPASGPIGHLVVRPDEPNTLALRHCACCGDPLTEGRRYRCEPCQHALWLALNTSPTTQQSA